MQKKKFFIYFYLNLSKNLEKKISTKVEKIFFFHLKIIQLMRKKKKMHSVTKVLFFKSWKNWS